MNYSIEITKSRLVQYTKPEHSTAEQDLFAIALLIKCVLNSLDTIDEKKFFINGIKKVCDLESIQKKEKDIIDFC